MHLKSIQLAILRLLSSMLILRWMSNGVRMLQVPSSKQCRLMDPNGVYFFCCSVCPLQLQHTHTHTLSLNIPDLLSFKQQVRDLALTGLNQVSVHLNEIVLDSVFNLYAIWGCCELGLTSLTNTVNTEATLDLGLKSLTCTAKRGCHIHMLNRQYHCV